MIVNGKKLNLRKSNHKYDCLDNIDELYKVLLTKSIGELSRETGIPNNSIRYRTRRYFTEDQLASIKKDRRYKHLEKKYD